MNNKVSYGFSAFFGLCFGIATYFIVSYILPEDAVAFAVIVGLSACASLFVYFLIHNKHTEKAFQELEKTISSPIFLKTNSNIRVNNRVFNRNIYFCESGIVFASVEKKSFGLQEVQLNDIIKIEQDLVRLNIFTKNDGMFCCTIPKVNDVVEALKNKGWME